ncbi:MAG: YHS domain-containing (seleno)protein [Planctomycetota bacterium]
MFTKPYRNVALLSAAAFTLIAAVAWTPAVAQSTQAADTPENYTIQVGILGYSPVSYFTEGEAQPGSPKYTATHDGVTYFFTSAEQVDLFNANPHKYVPAYGGWCAFGAAVENHFPISPESFKIVDGRLMLFLHNDEADALELWNGKDEAQMVRQADAFWKRAHGGRAGG